MEACQWEVDLMKTWVSSLKSELTISLELLLGFSLLAVGQGADCKPGRRYTDWWTSDFIDATCI